MPPRSLLNSLFWKLWTICSSKHPLSGTRKNRKQGIMSFFWQFFRNVGLCLLFPIFHPFLRYAINSPQQPAFWFWIRELKSRVIYKLDCPGCHACYVGMTSRHLKTRLAEHQRDNATVKQTSIGINTMLKNFQNQFWLLVWIWPN